MHQLMQHRLSGMYLAQNGTLTPYIWAAEQFDDLASAVKACNQYHIAPSDFVFRIFEPEPGEELQRIGKLA